MPKSTIADIVIAISIVNKLDKRGKRAILLELQRQNLFQPDLTKEQTEEKEENR